MKDPQSLVLGADCSLSAAQLRAMAAQQQQQIEAQQRLLVAREQRLKFLKQQGSGGGGIPEQERLRRMKDRVDAQEAKLRRLRALRGQVDSTRLTTASLTSDLDEMRQQFSAKEKEMAVAVARVDELTRQLELLRGGRLPLPPGGGGGPAPPTGGATHQAELDRLRRELLYRNSVNRESSGRVAVQRELLTAKTQELSRLDRRIADLQARLHRKKLLNHQLAQQITKATQAKQAQLRAVKERHKEPQGDAPPPPAAEGAQEAGAELGEFTGLKQDPKYKTLPHNTKLCHQQQQGTDSTQPPNTEQPHQAQPSVVDNRHLTNNNTNNRTSSTNNSVNSNMGFINSNSPSINSNAGPINSNSGPINSNVVSINSNAGPINSNSGPINSNVVSTNSNAGPINNNAGPINNDVGATNSSLTDVFNSNAGSINSNTGSINSNAGSINSNSSSINSNAGSINSNAGSINSNSSSINSNTGSVNSTTGSINSNTSSINSNTGSVNSTTGSINSNLRPITSNAGSINSGDASINSTNKSGVPHTVHSTPTNRASRGHALAPASSTVTTSTSLPSSVVTTSSYYSTPSAYVSTSTSTAPSTATSAALATSTALPKVEASAVDTSTSTSRTLSLSQQHQQKQQQQAKPALPPKPTTTTTSTTTTATTTTATSSQPPLTTTTATTMVGPLPATPPRLKGESVDNKEPPTTTSSKTAPRSFITHNRPLFPSSLVASTINSLQSRSAPSGNGASTSNNVTNIRATTGGGDVAVSQPAGGALAGAGSSDDPARRPVHVSINRRIEMPPDFMFPESETPSDLLGRPGDTQSTAQDQAPEDAPERGADTTDRAADAVTEIIQSVRLLAELPLVRRKGNLKTHSGLRLPRRVSFDPLALLLDASLEGELELVKRTAMEVPNPSAANDEGITALHNAICAGHLDIVTFLVTFGCDVNAQDSDGWTPLHCAASCNNLAMVRFLVEHGACILATTLSDHETPAEKCEQDEEGYDGCSQYLYSIQEKLGILNGGLVYAVYDYTAQNSDELSFKCGDAMTVLRRGDECEREWWWGQLHVPTGSPPGTGGTSDPQGYLPRNLLGLYPRVKNPVFCSEADGTPSPDDGMTDTGLASAVAAS